MRTNVNWKIYLVGASGVGKTTLASFITDKYGIACLPSPSRRVLDSGQEFATKLDRQRAIYQVMKEQFDAHSDSSYAADRSVEVIAYTRLCTQSRDELIHDMRDYCYYLLTSPDACVIRIRPHADTTTAARAEGRRLEFLTDQMIDDVDYMVGEELTAIGCPKYLEITSPDQTERRTQITDWLARYGVKPLGN